jgi:lipopolysaccharide biosynthesis protein
MILVTYIYYETTLSILNLNFFIQNGVFENDEVHYNFVINSDSIVVDIPKHKNITIIKGDNRGHDFGAYSKSINEVDINDYDYFIFLNDTVRGPFLPRYCTKDWYNKFISLITNRVKLVGSTINKSLDELNKHVQSMAFATDKIGIQLLLNANIFNQDLNEKVYLEKGKTNFVSQFEVKMSGIIIDNGYKIDSFCQIENNRVDIHYFDIHFNNRYFGSTINPIEVMFVKTNRITTIDLQNYTAWNM